jgi:hypothetical protein
MKNPILTLAVLLAISAGAQPAASLAGAPFSPALRGFPASPVNAGLPASPANPGLPGFNSTFAGFFTNQLGSNLISEDLGPILVDLQNDIQQAMPLLTAFIGNAESGNFTNGASTAGTTPTSIAVTRPTGNSSGLVSQNFSTLASRDVSTHFPIATAGAAQTPASSTQAGAIGFLSPTGVTNSTGLRPGFGSLIDSNGFPAVSNPNEVFRQLVILEDDMERMLPIVVALNGGSLTAMTGAVTNSAATVNNVFNPITFPAANPSSRAATPTGR